MYSWLYWYLLLLKFIIIEVIANTAHIRSVDAQQNERIRLECKLSSKLDAEEAMWMRIRPPHNPDVLTYRDSVVYAADRIQLEQRRLSSSIDANGTLVDTYFLTLTILRPTIDDEGRYVCARRKHVFAEYDLFIIVPTQFVDDRSGVQQGTVIEGSTLHLTCSAHGRPLPSITWYARNVDGKHLPLNDGKTCQETRCELHLTNYTRNDPTEIECVADNVKSTRISKIFHVDVHYSPKVNVTLRKFMGTQNINILIQCATTSNPPASMLWYNDQRQIIDNQQIYTIKSTNQSSTLSFSMSPKDRFPSIFYCASENYVGHDEQMIDVIDLMKFDMEIETETTTIVSLNSTIIMENDSATKKTKTARPHRAKSRISQTSTTLLMTTTTNIANSLNKLTLSSIVKLILFQSIYYSV